MGLSIETNNRFTLFMKHTLFLDQNIYFYFRSGWEDNEIGVYPSIIQQIKASTEAAVV